MADNNEIKKVISVDIGNTATTLKDYKKHIDDLRASLLGLDETSEAYQKIAGQIKEEQDKLNQVMKVGKGHADAEEGSYNHLANTLAELKKQWRATSDEAERASIGQKIVEVNDKLKALDASTGDFRRNVGNYSGAMKEAFTALPGPIGKSTSGLKGLGTQMKALLANPIVAIVAAVTAAITTLTKSIKGNEEQMQQLKEAFSVFEPVVNLVKNTVTKFAQTVVDLFTRVSSTITSFVSWVGRQARNLGFDELADKIESFTSMQAESVRLSKEENDLLRERRKTEKEISDNEVKISELRAKTYDTEKWSAKERKQFLEDIEALEISNASKKHKLAEREYELIKKKNSLAQNSTADYEKENQALIAMNNALVDLNNKQASTNKKMSSINKELSKSSTTLKEIRDLSATEAIQPLSLLGSKDDIELSIDAALKIYESKVKEANEQFKHDETMLKLTGDVDSAEYEQQQFDLQQARVQAHISANLEILDNDKLTEEERRRILNETDELKAQLAYNERARVKESEKVAKKSAEEELKYRKMKYNQILSASADLFGSLSEMAGENSEAQKAFAIMETVINTLQAVIATWAGYGAMGPFGTVAAIAQTAAITASGIATIAKMKSTTKDNASLDSSSTSALASSPTGSASGMSPVAMPMLDEQYDINRLEAAQPHTQQNLKVYVVEQDIRDATHRVDVTEASATF